MSQQGIEKTIFRVSFQIDFEIMTTMILENTISRFNVFQLKVFIAECITLETHKKKLC